jgi:transcriptional regulator with XRE-family HTH domain
MNVKAIGAYFRRKARENRLTIKAVAEEAGVGPNYIWRLENGSVGRPSAELLKAITRAVRGTWEEVGHFLDPTIDKDILDAIVAEEVALAIAEDQAEFALVPEDREDEIAQIIARLRAQPFLLARWIDYGRGLADAGDDKS